MADVALSFLFSSLRELMFVIPPQTEPEDDNITNEERKRQKEKLVENIMKTAQMHLVVATLLMTVTFTAGFTLPGGFESDINSPNKGMAVLLRRTAFCAFVVTDAFAFTCSSGAVFAYFAMAANVISAAKDPRVIFELYNTATSLLIYGMVAVVVAFATGMYVTLEHSLGLAITVCSIGCGSIIVFCYTRILLPKKGLDVQT